MNGLNNNTELDQARRDAIFYLYHNDIKKFLQAINIIRKENNK